MPQVLGGYTFEDDPESMQIPERKKTVATVETYSGVATFQWAPSSLPIGQHIELTWTVITNEMYQELRQRYLDMEVQIWQPGDGSSYHVVVADLQGRYVDAVFQHNPHRLDVVMTLCIVSQPSAI